MPSPKSQPPQNDGLIGSCATPPTAPSAGVIAERPCASLAGKDAAAAAADDDDGGGGNHDDVAELPSSSAEQRHQHLQALRMRSLVAPHTGATPWIVAATHLTSILLGPGTLALQSVLSRLGVVAGPLAMVLMFCLCSWTSAMLADVHQFNGRRHARYSQAVRSILASTRWTLLLTVSQQTNLFLACISYQTATADSLSYIVTAACSLSRGGQHQPCWSSRPAMLGAVGVLQLLLSQMRNLAAARWLSAAGSAATFGYVAIIFGLSAANAAAGKGQGLGASSIIPGAGRPLPDAVFEAANAIGAVAFSLNAPIITLEVTDTIRPPPARSMRAALRLTLVTCISSFLLTGLLGHAVLGSLDAPNILLAFEGRAPGWLLLAGSGLVAVNMVSGFQVCAQAGFAAAEAALRRRQELLPRPLAALAKRRPWVLPLVLRTLCVVLTSVLSYALRSFSVILGLVAAATFYQTSVLMPILLFRAAKQPGRAWRAVAGAVLVVMAALWCFVIVGTVAVIVRQAMRVAL